MRKVTCVGFAVRDWSHMVEKLHKQMNSNKMKGPIVTKKTSWVIRHQGLIWHKTQCGWDIFSLTFPKCKESSYLRLNKQIPSFWKSPISLSSLSETNRSREVQQEHIKQNSRAADKFWFQFYQQSCGRNIQSLPLPYEHCKRTSRSLSCSHFHIMSRWQGTLKIYPSESTKGAGPYKHWPPLFTDY